LYKHEHATLIVMQNLYATVDKHQSTNEFWDLLANILAVRIDHAQWHYLLLAYAALLAHAPAGSFGLAELNKLMRTLYTWASDEEIRELLNRYRDAGLVCFCAAALGPGALLTAGRNLPGDASQDQ
jgi:hypothetical protein